ncbi:crotonobetaine/carnitine-CoA ligase [Thermomonospora echinospora]|uniref:Crotonobetaine/carnitine-CoA ligase n=1 Tax=Thermomonospora echinospora TaxID=1992 RepID=A0A1H6AJN8_9ACTN|nr:AMP-binding protein [Thermomonospora echinospora]SEG48287.1 crotonobetaine/carnitine-CoA ligase [Thermomonospora echinospora]
MKDPDRTQFGPSGYALIDEPTLPALVSEWAQVSPDRGFLDPVGGTPRTFGQVHEAANRWAVAHAGAGVGRGDLVLSMLRPGSVAVEQWLGTARAGAIDVGVNTDLIGTALHYVLRDTAARVAVVEPDYLDRFAALPDLAELTLIVVAGDVPPEAASLPCAVVTTEAHLAAADADAAPVEQPARHDIACIIYTSGTTGSPKGVMMPWGQFSALLPEQWQSGAEHEAQYVPFPFYHVAGRMTVHLMARLGGRAVLRSRFSLSAFWDDIKRHNCTMVLLAGAVPQMLLGAKRPEHTDNPLRRVIMAPVIEAHEEFTSAFGVDIVTGYNMTETSLPFYQPDGVRDWRSCGRLRDGFPYYEARLVDENDQEVPTGQVGELMVRTGVPWTLNAGYFGKPEATVRAWRNGWFHTGDAFRRDDEGSYYFVDRMTDSIRRRGENISSADIEAAVLNVESVAECAAIGVPSPLGEQDIKIVVRLHQGVRPAEAELLDGLTRVLPRFMVPRYVEYVTDFPRTEATHRIRKTTLRAKWRNERVWDGERGDWLPEDPAS